MNITDRPGYDNQPTFASDGSAISKMDGPTFTATKLR
jgi:hypothetical protein